MMVRKKTQMTLQQQLHAMKRVLSYMLKDYKIPFALVVVCKEIAPTLLEEYERLKEELRPLQRPRPQWDIQLLEAVGFHSIQVDTTVWQRVYGKQDEFYNPTPIFTIVARK